MAETEIEGIFLATRIGVIEMHYDVDRDAGRRCAEAVRASMRTPSVNAAKGYLSAAQWFALAAANPSDR